MGKYFNKKNLFEMELRAFLLYAFQTGDIKKDGKSRKTLLMALLKHKIFDGDLKFIEADNFPEIIEREKFLSESDDPAYFQFDLTKLNNLCVQKAELPMRFATFSYSETIERQKQFDCPQNPAVSCFICQDNFEELREHFATKHATNLLRFVFPRQDIVLQDTQQMFGMSLHLAEMTNRPLLLCYNLSEKDVVINQIYMVVDGDIINALLKVPAFLEIGDQLKMELSVKYFEHLDNEFLFVVMAETDKELIETYNLTVNGLIPEFIIANRMLKKNEADRLDYLEIQQKRNIPEFKPRHCLRQFFDNAWNLKDDIDVEGLDSTEIEDYNMLKMIADPGFQLMESNYVHALSTLTYVEDLFVSSELARFEMVFTVDTTDGNFVLSLSGQPGIPAMISEVDTLILFPIDFEDAKKRKVRTKIQCNILHIADGVVTFAPITGTIPLGMYRVRFEKDRTCTKIELDAITRLDFLTVQAAIFPKVCGHFKNDLKSMRASPDTMEWFNAAIETNAKQQKAVCDIINGIAYPAPYICNGPPGTGKSTVLVEAIAQIFKLMPEARILLVAPSNFACDEITTRLMYYVPSSDIYRLYSKSFERKLDDIDDSLILVSNLLDGLHQNPSITLINQYRIVVATLVTCGRLALRTVKKNEFHYIFIDEAASASEQSTLIPISGLVSFKDKGCTNLVLAGDPKQLNYLISSRFAQNSVMHRSMLERLSEDALYIRSQQVITRLTDNFRSHASILQVFNGIFYNNELVAKAAETKTGFAVGWKCLPNGKFPIIFHAIYGECGTEINTFSLINENEVSQVLFYVSEIVRNGINGYGISLTDIGIVSPYAAQVQRLKDILRRCGWSDIEVGSAEQFQGREKLIIIVTTVRSFTTTVGFLDNPRRMNVLLSRAMALLIVVGNPLTLKMDPNWAQLIKYCEENGATIDTNEVPAEVENEVVITSHYGGNEDELIKRLNELDLAFR